MKGLEAIVTNCKELTEANFSLILSKHEESFLCQNLTTKIEKLSLKDLTVNDQDIETLVKRCQNLQQLHLGNCTNVTQRSLKSIVSNLTQLEKFYLPVSIKVKQLIPFNDRLKCLWLPPRIHSCRQQIYAIPPLPVRLEVANHNKKLKALFPHLTINEGNLHVPDN